MSTPRAAGIPLIVICLLLLVAGAASAQVATLRTPDPAAEASPSPAVAPDSEGSMLGFSSCMREHGIDLPDPSFGVGALFASGAMSDIDMMSGEFLEAFGACQGYLAAAIPAVDPAELAERTERAVAFAECMRERGIDWPDPDPISGMTFASMRADDGGLVFNPLDPGFQESSRACAEETGASVPGMPGAPGS